MNEAVLPELADPRFKSLVNQCIHCGLCLQACPTYEVFGTEMDAPRGRISLMRAASEGRIGPDDLGETFARHINLCLSCLSCQTACPSGVKYAKLIETTKVALEHHRKQGAGRTRAALGRPRTDDAARRPAQGGGPAAEGVPGHGRAEAGAPPRTPARAA